MYELVIAGGGIHGTFLSHVMATRVGVGNLLVIDPHEKPLAVWNRHTSACGMSYLRSPSGHNLDLNFSALRAYARQAGWDPDQSFIPPYARPKLGLFNEHAAAVIQRHNLERYRMRATVLNVRLFADHVQLDTDAGPVMTRYVLFATGQSSSLCRPTWAEEIDPDQRIISHIFSQRFVPEMLDSAGTPVIVGAGASGVQRALACRGERPVTLITERPWRVQRFDSNPCFIGPKCYSSFLSESDYHKRRAIIQEARAPGTIPQDVAHHLTEALGQGRIRIVTDSITAVRRGTGTVTLSLSHGGELITDRVVLATGFAPTLPSLIRQLGVRYALPCHTDGFPLPDRYLRWHDRVFLTGRPAELELGPAAANIIGAVNAAKRVASFFLDNEAAELLPDWAPLSRLLSTA